MKEANVITLYSRVKEYRGAINGIANRVSCHREWVRLVLQGKYYDEKVIHAAIEEVRLRDARKQRLLDQISSIATTPML